MRRAGHGGPSPRLAVMLEEEQAMNLADAAALRAFASAVQAWKTQFEALIAELAASGARLVGYGAAAKGNTLLNYCADAAGQLQVILDRSPHKQGLYTPGTHIRVESADAWRELGATHMLILAWNFRHEIMRQMVEFDAAGGRFVVPIPQPYIV
jgi:hypothetical protein